MALTFINGGSPDYQGVLVPNGASILTEIRNGLEQAGWQIQISSIGIGNELTQNLVVSCTSSPDNITVYYRFRIVDDSANVANGLALSIQGSQNSGFTSVSKEYLLNFLNINSNSRLWLTADEESFVICLLSFSSLSGSVFGGFLKRIEETDSGAYCIGYLLSDVTKKPGNQFMQIGVSAHNNINWMPMLDVYQFTNYESNGQLSSANAAPMQGIFDRYTVCTIPYTNFSYTSTTDVTKNISANAMNGQINGITNQAIIGEYFFPEGRQRGGYSVTGILSPQLYYRGPVRNAVVGMASYPAGIQLIDNQSGNRYLSGGSVGWQGFRIN